MCPSYTVQAILPWDWCEECEFECWTLILGLGSLGVKVWEGFIFGSGSFMLSSRCEGSKIFIFSSIIRRGDGGNSFWTSLNQSPVTAFSFSENKCDEMFAKLFRITVFIAGHTPPSVSPFTFTALKHFSPLNCSGIKNEPSELSQVKSNRLSPAVLKPVILTGMKKWTLRGTRVSFICSGTVLSGSVSIICVLESAYRMIIFTWHVRWLHTGHLYVFATAWTMVVIGKAPEHALQTLSETNFGFRGANRFLSSLGLRVNSIEMIHEGSWILMHK